MKASGWLLSMLAIVAGVSAQGQFGAAENSAAVLQALRSVDNSTKLSGNAARLFRPGVPSTRTDLETRNIFLRSDWQAVIYTAQSSSGFYTTEGAQAIIDYVNNVLFPDTAAADRIYVNKRDAFVRSGFIDFINTGLLQLRTAVDAASAALQARTPSSRLQAMTIALTQIELNYAQTQEFQQFGPGGAP